MTGYLTSPWGTMQAGIGYEILEEGYDYYLFKNGIYVDKDIVSFDDPGGDDDFYGDDDYSRMYYEDLDE